MKIRADILLSRKEEVRSREEAQALMNWMCDLYGEKIISECDSVVVEIDMEPDLLNRIFWLAEEK